jgi:hypothetical protein
MANWLVIQHRENCGEKTLSIAPNVIGIQPFFSEPRPSIYRGWNSADCQTRVRPDVRCIPCVVVELAAFWQSTWRRLGTPSGSSHLSSQGVSSEVFMTATCCRACSSFVGLPAARDLKNSVPPPPTPTHTVVVTHFECVSRMELCASLVF